MSRNTMTSTGTRIASTVIVSDETSSTVETTGAPVPAVERLTTARALAFATCVDSASTTPMTKGHTALLVKNAPGSVIAGVSDVEPAANTMPPAVGRTNVCTTSLTWSTAGTLSATTSSSSSTPRTTSHHPSSSHSHCAGSSTVSV